MIVECVFYLRCLLRFVFFYIYVHLFEHKLRSNHDVMHF